MGQSKEPQNTFVSLILFFCFLLFFPFHASADDTFSATQEKNADIPNNDNSLHIKWGNAGDGFTYRFQMARDKDFNQMIVDLKSDKPEVTIQRPDGIGTYYVRTKFIAKDGNEGSFSPVQRLQIEDLERPVILSPKEISEFRGVYTIAFKWRQVPHATGYHFLLANDRAFMHIVHEETNITGDSLAVQDLGSGTYYARVSAVAKNGREGPFSEMVSFIISPPPPGINSVK